MLSPVDAAAGERPGRGLTGLLALCVLLTLAMGAIKVFAQKASPPDYALNPSNSYEGWVSIDGHSHRAARIHAWLRGADGGGSALLDHLRHDRHPSSLAVPVLVAGGALFTGSIPASFLLLSLAAVVLQLLLVGRIAARLAPGAGGGVPLLAALLAAGHCLTIRTAGQLQLDPFAAVLASAVALLCIARARKPRAGSAGLLLLVQVLGVFTKTSHMPLLAAPALSGFLMLSLSGSPWRERLRCAALDLLRYALLPALLYVGWLGWLSGAGSISKEVDQLTGYFALRPRELLGFAVEMALLFQAFPLLLWLRRRVLSRADLCVLAALACTLIGTWIFKLPAVPRYYLPALGFLAAASAPALAGLPPRASRPALLALYLLGNYAVATWSLLGHLS